MYDWLIDQTKEVKTAKFYVFRRDLIPETLQKIDCEFGIVASGFKQYLEQFGESLLFRDMERGSYNLIIFSLPKIYVNDKGDHLLRIGRSKNQSAFFVKRAHGDLSQAVFQGRPYCVRKTADSFEEWLPKAFDSCKKLYTKKEWKEILAGPIPFNQRELEIVEAIPQFTFEKVGVAPNGDVRIKVHNGSRTRLRCLTVGVNAPKRLISQIRLDVSDLASGETKIVEEDVYKVCFVDPETVELFRMPIPDPSERKMYYEFREAL